MQALLERCVARWRPNATGVTGLARLSGGASQETWSFEIVGAGGNRGAILRRAPAGARGRAERRSQADAGGL